MHSNKASADRPQPCILLIREQTACDVCVQCKLTNVSSCRHQNRDAYGRPLPEVEEQVQSGSQVVKAGRHQPAQHECAVGCCGTGWNVTESLAMRSW